MNVNKLFIGNIYILDKSNFIYGPQFAPLSLSKTIYKIHFKKRALLYEKENNIFIDLEEKEELKTSNTMSDVNIGESFVMMDDKFIPVSNIDNVKRKDIKKLVKILRKK